MGFNPKKYLERNKNPPEKGFGLSEEDFDETSEEFEEFIKTEGRQNNIHFKIEIGTKSSEDL